MKVLILCTGNSCRSQMAEGFLRNFKPEFEIFSAGTKPADVVNPKAVIVMDEIGIDISLHTPENVEKYLNDEFDYVITVCGGANESCPAFVGTVKNRVHIGFDDPVDAVGTEEEQLLVYRRVRDEIRRDFTEFFKNIN